MISIKNIVKSRFIKGEDLPGWYEERLSKCSTCSLNSANVGQSDKSSLRKGWEIIAGAHCMHQDCGCTITEKAKVDTESCPEKNWLAIENINSSSINIETTSNKVVLSYVKGTARYVADYGAIPYKFESSIILSIKDKSVSDLVVKSACGCTVAGNTKTAEGYDITIRYDTLRLNKFSKDITLTYNKEGVRKQTVITIKGDVKK